MKVLFVCNEYPPSSHGGIGIFTKRLAEGLIKEGVECTVAGLYAQQADSVEDINGVRVYRFRAYDKKTSGTAGKIAASIFNKYKLSQKIKELIRKHQIDIVESYEWNGPLSSKPSVKTIIRLHGSNAAYSEYEKRKVSKFLFWAERKNIDFADAVVAVSQHILDITQTTFGEIKKTRKVIYNSVSSFFRPIHSVERNPYRLLFVGKFHQRKGVYELFEILNHLFGHDNRYTFSFIGNHTDENRIELLSYLNEEYHNRVAFVKAIPQEALLEYYSTASLMIMPSRAEAFGLTAIEAKACGCVVAMANTATGPELITDGIDGLLIDSFDYEQSAQKIHECIQDTAKMNTIREAGIQQVEKYFSEKVIIKENLEFYNSLHEKH